MRRLIIILSTIFLIQTAAKAQYYQTGVEPGYTKWRQIESGKIRVIYPSEYEDKASSYLNLLLTTDSLTGRDYNLKSKRIDVVLHPNSMLSNGFVAWAPRRMELITFPSTDGYAQPWSSQLALHEMRHVKQMYALNSSTSRLAYYLFGEQVVGLAAGLVPQWFLEGDAVVTETAHSFSGRGRSATFWQHYRAHFLADRKTYSYNKWLLGSYKNYIPNNYSLGYQLVSFGNFKYGINTWPKVVNHVAKYPFTAIPFYFGVKQNTGLPARKLADSTFAYLSGRWKADTVDRYLSAVNHPVRMPKSYTSYLYPYKLNDSTMLAYRTSLNDIPAFVEINLNSQKVKELCYPGYLLGRPTYSDSLIVWAEYQPHTRWEYEDFGRIYGLRIKDAQKIELSGKGKYFSPAINPDDCSVLCISYSPDGNFKLVSIGKKREERELLSFSSGYEVQELSFDRNTRMLYALVVTQQGKEIVSVDINKSFNVVYGPTFDDVNSIYAFDSRVIFSSTDGDVENIYLHNNLTDSTVKIYNSRYSSRYCSVTKNHELIFSDYTPDGYTIGTSTIDLDNQKNDLISNRVNNSYPNFTLIGKGSVVVDTLQISDSVFSSKPYKGAGTLFNVHSWMPFFVNIDGTEVTSINPGVMLLSQNLTGTLTSSIGYGYGNSHLFHTDVTYYGFWPVLSVRFNLYDEDAFLYRVTENPVFPNKNRWEAKLNVYLPLQLANSSYQTYLQPFSDLTLSNDYLFSSNDSSYHSGIGTVNSGFYFHRLRNMAHRDLQPRMGLVFRLNLVNAPFNKNSLGSLQAANLKIFLPGFLANQGLKFSAAWQNQNLKRYYLGNEISFPRGFSENVSKKYLGASADYIFPFITPDLSLGALAYIKRISVNLFYDYARNSYLWVNNNNEIAVHDNLTSCGFEIITDFHLFRFRFPFRLVVQQAFTGSNWNPYTNVSLTLDVYGEFWGNKVNRTLGY